MNYQKGKPYWICVIEVIFFHFQGAIASITQGYISLPGCVSNNGGCTYSGQIFAEGYTAIATDGNDIPAAVLVANHMFRIEHTQLNVAQTSMEGFKLQFTQLPCAGYTTYDRTTGYENMT